MWTLSQRHYMLGGVSQDLAISHGGYVDTRDITPCQLVVNIACWCSRLKTLALRANNCAFHPANGFPSAVSCLTALESLALHNLSLSVRHCHVTRVCADGAVKPQGHALVHGICH